MSINDILLLIAIGMCAGVLSSLVGVGGGIVIVPGLVMLFGISQKMAQGTSLAMLLPPIGVLGVMVYHKEGNIKWDYALILILSFILGSFFGAKWVQGLNGATLKKVFAIFMMVVAVKYLFFDKSKPKEEIATETVSEKNNHK